MAGKGTPPPIDYATLAEFLTAMGYPVRLQLLELLRFPHTVGEIALAPHRVHQGISQDRAVARQTVQVHLDKLVEADLVRVELVEQAGREIHRYVVNPQKLYGLLEELRRLSTRYAGSGAGADATGTLPGPPPAEARSGPRLVLVHGAYEGRAFPLDARAPGKGPWVIGRDRSCSIALDYDPYVSTENAVVERTSNGFNIADLDGSKNGTSVNWQPLAKGDSRPLRPGDVIGVGRSLLVFAN